MFEKPLFNANYTFYIYISMFIFMYACFKKLAINNRKKPKIKSVSSQIIIGRLKCYCETLQIQNFKTQHCPCYEH